MITIEFHPEADQELSEAKSWYRERSKLAARAFATDIAESLRHIAASPTRWPEARSGERRYVLARFPFLYRIKNSVVFITAVAHQKRPGYWRDR
ncbi:MAG: type II toxin-antitoxin system RelE/ParE family toxin [Pyrinomonadaceae bacterium]|nr:type II toxin-antitoxin system RelE/ParE family toxin [Pyrinomonadaceae bacterium]